MCPLPVNFTAALSARPFKDPGEIRWNIPPEMTSPLPRDALDSSLVVMATAIPGLWKEARTRADKALGFEV